MHTYINSFKYFSIFYVDVDDHDSTGHDSLIIRVCSIYLFFKIIKKN